MRKILYSIISLLFMTLLTGCGNKEVVKCKTKFDESELEYEITLKENKVTDIELELIYDLSNFPQDYINIFNEEDLCLYIKNDLEDYKKAFVNCKQKLKDKKIIINAEIDPKKSTDHVMKERTTAKNIKEDYEKEGYTCTIK